MSQHIIFLPQTCFLANDVLPLRENDHTGADMRAAQEGASPTNKIGNGILRKVLSEFFNPSTVTIALPHHHLTTSARSGPHLALTGAVLLQDMSISRLASRA